MPSNLGNFETKTQSNNFLQNNSLKTENQKTKMFRCAKPKPKPKMETQNISNNKNKHQNQQYKRLCKPLKYQDQAQKPPKKRYNT